MEGDIRNRISLQDNKMDNFDKNDSDIVQKLTTPETAVGTFYLYVAVGLMTVIIVSGSTGNALVIYIVKTTRKLHNVSNIFIVNLSICDLVFVSCILPFNIYTYTSDGWYLSQHLCKVIGFIGYSLTGTTIITITLIAYNRYKLILDPSNYNELYTRRNILIMLMFSWITPSICLLPALLEVWGKFGYEAMLVTCNLLLDHNSQSYKLFLLLFRAGIPCTLIVFYYGRIYYTMKCSHRRMQHISSRSTLTSIDARNQKKEMHLTRMMVIIFLVFIISYLPCTITGVIDWNTVLSKRFHMFCITSVYIGSAVNPIIYGLMNEQFRRAYFRLLCCCYTKQQKQLKTSENKTYVKVIPTNGHLKEKPSTNVVPTAPSPFYLENEQLT